MATDPKAAQRSARSHRKRKHLASAELAGADIIDATIVTRAPDGHFVVFRHDGEPIHLIERVIAQVAPVEVAQPAEPTKLQVPKAIQKIWPATHKYLLKLDTRQAALDFAEESAQDPEQAEGARALTALLEKLPDTPDWHASLPEVK